MSAAGRRPASVRALLLLMAAGAGLYVALLGAYVLLVLQPAAMTLEARADALATEYDSLGARTRTLRAAFHQVETLTGGRRVTAADRQRLDSIGPGLAALARQSAGLQASALLTNIPAAMRVSLANAAGAESRTAGTLLEAVAALEAGDLRAAAAWAARADSSGNTLGAQLADAQRAGLSDLAGRERVLGLRAGRVAQGVVLWVVLGAAFVALALLVLQRRLYAPLAVLDHGLARVAEGDLDASLPVRRPDELGRLTGHFNEMTQVLRSRPEVETLRRERFLVDTLMEHVPDSIYFKDAGGRFLRINRAMARRAGLADPADATGRTDQDLFRAEHADAARKDEEEIIRTGRAVVNLEERETWSDGRVTWVSSTKMPLRDPDGRVVGTFGISRDITERKEAELALEASEARFRTAFMTVPDAHYLATRDEGRILEVNERFKDVFGWDRDEVVGRTSLDLALYANPADRGRMLAELRASGHVRSLDVLARRKNGETIPVLLSVSEIRSGDPPLILGVVRDVSEQKRSAEALKSLEEQVRQAQRLEAVGRLAGGVAHDFNNILTAITGYTELLLEDFRGQDPRRADLEEIRAAAQRAAALTGQLLAFSRKQVLQPRILDLNEVVRGLEKMLRRLIGEDVVLEFAPGADLWAVRADPGQIEQVILNLAVNARDAMPHGGRLTVETANVELDGEDARRHADLVPGAYVRVTVSDTGTGMDADTAAHIFEPFFTTKEVGKGTGLGLATVHGIVSQSGGHITVESESGRGATFQVYLPRVEALAEAPGAAPGAPLAVQGHETVLVAEDDRAVRDVVAATLSQRGYRVLRANDGPAALELAQSVDGRVDLLLTDLVMPGMTGRELAQALAARQRGLRVLFMSGYTDDAIVRRGVLEEGMPYLQKPFSPDALALKVREVLDRRRSGETKATGR